MKRVEPPSVTGSSFCMQFFSLYVRAVLPLDKVLTEIRGLDGLFRDLHATSLTKNRKKHDWKLLGTCSKIHTERKLIVF